MSIFVGFLLGLIADELQKRGVMQVFFDLKLPALNVLKWQLASGCDGICERERKINEKN